MAADVVAILDASLAQVFATARAMKATVREEAKVMEHPLESGSPIIDHRVILPVEIELSMILPGTDAAATYARIREFFGRAELLTIQTRAGSYPNMLIVQLPHEETPDSIGALKLALKLREAQLVSVQFSELKVAKPQDSNTVKRGEQQPQATAKRQSSILSGFFK